MNKVYIIQINRKDSDVQLDSSRVIAKDFPRAYKKAEKKLEEHKKLDKDVELASVTLTMVVEG